MEPASAYSSAFAALSARYLGIACSRLSLRALHPSEVSRHQFRDVQSLSGEVYSFHRELELETTYGRFTAQVLHFHSTSLLCWPDLLLDQTNLPVAASASSHAASEERPRAGAREPEVEVVLPDARACSAAGAVKPPPEGV